MSHIKYRPEIDGLRALAVVPVLLFHLGFEWIPGGFIGVDVFYVISGFLITSIILKDYEQGIFSFSNFWKRRVRRIFPVFLAMVTVVSVTGYIVLYGPDIHLLGKQSIAALFSYANIFYWFHAGNYWGPQAENSPLLHTWSLSVEEQFYLFFPLLLIFILKVNKRWLLPIITSLVMISFVLFIYGTQYHSAATFYLLPTRAWELGCGCLLAILFFNVPPQQTQFSKFNCDKIMPLLGIVAIVLSYAFISGEGGISPYLIIPVLGSVFIIAWSRGKETLTAKLLSFTPVVYIGKISYSLYIWHWPIIVLSKNFLDEGKIVLTPLYSIPLIIVISILSYHFIEQPTRRMHNIIAPVMATFILSMSFSLFLSNTYVAEDITMYSETTWKGQMYNVAPKLEIVEGLENKRMDGIITPVREPYIHNIYETGGVIKAYHKETPEVVILGNSHALMWAGVLDEILEELNASVSFYAADGTPVFFNLPIKKTKATTFFDAGEKFIFDKMRYKFLNQWKPKVVIIAVRWESIKNIQETQDLMEMLGEIGSRVILIEQPPLLFIGDRNAPQYLSFMKVFPENNERKYISKLESRAYMRGLALVRQMVEKYPHCELIPVADIFMKGNKVWVLDGSNVLYIDDDHLSYQGSLKARKRIKQTLQKYL